MLIGVTAACYTENCSIQESMWHIKNTGYDCVDFNLSSFSSPDGPLMSDAWGTWSNDVRRAASDAGLYIHQAHAWFGLSISDFAYSPPSKLFYRSIEACALLGAKELIFHPVFFRNIGDSIEIKEKLFDYNIRWFLELAETARAHKIFIDIENTINIKDPPRHVPFTTSDDMLSALSALDDEVFGICLDTGHANIMNLDNAEMIHKFDGKLRALHLNDNIGPIFNAPFDQHFFPGTGTINFPALFRALKDIGFPGVFVLEPKGFLARMPLSVRHIAMASGAAVTRAFASEAGYE